MFFFDLSGPFNLFNMFKIILKNLVLRHIVAQWKVQSKISFIKLMITWRICVFKSSLLSFSSSLSGLTGRIGGGVVGGVTSRLTGEDRRGILFGEEVAIGGKRSELGRRERDGGEESGEKSRGREKNGESGLVWDCGELGLEGRVCFLRWTFGEVSGDFLLSICELVRGSEDIVWKDGEVEDDGEDEGWEEPSLDPILSNFLVRSSSNRRRLTSLFPDSLPDVEPAGEPGLQLFLRTPELSELSLRSDTLTLIRSRGLESSSSSSWSRYSSLFSWFFSVFSWFQSLAPVVLLCSQSPLPSPLSLSSLSLCCCRTSSAKRLN